MAYFYKTYNLIKDYVEHHKLILEYGFYSNSDKQPQYIDEKKFSLELNKSNYVILKFKGEIYIVVCKKQLFKDTVNFNKMGAITSKRAEMLLIYEYELEQKKLTTFLAENKPIVNAIPLQTFLLKLKHISLPATIELYDFEKESEILLIQKKQLSEINFNDPVIAYLRLKPGQVIKIKNYAPTSGYFVEYRHVI